VRRRAPEKLIQVDRPESFVNWVSRRELRPRRAGLSGVRVIMTLMCVHSVVEPLSEKATRWLSALECQLLGAHGNHWLHFILSGT
jgi:hypothetical protein